MSNRSRTEPGRAPILLVRADSTPAIGMGHVMRMVALAQAWLDGGGKVHWLAAELLPSAKARIENEGIPIHTLQPGKSSEEDAVQTRQHAEQVGAHWIALDGYAFTEKYQGILKKSDSRLLCVDDLAAETIFPADIVLNQNIYAESALYAGIETEALFLLGPRYALLRREFGKIEKKDTIVPAQAKNILILLGGAGDASLARKMLQVLTSMAASREMSVRCVLGDAVRLQEIAAEPPSPWIQFLPRLDDMPSGLAWADMAVSAAGSTAYELLRMGVPCLLTAVADNQRAIADRLEAMELAFNLGPKEALTDEFLRASIERLADDPATRGRMAMQGRRMVDGQGSHRVRKAMWGALLQLREAGSDDCKRLWTWANDTETRASSFSSSLIPWEDHVRWFDAHIQDPRYRIYVAESQDGAPAGTVRFEMQAERAVISVSIDRAFRGEGYGRWLIRLGSQAILRNAAVAEVHAYIKPENAASIRAFESAGFVYRTNEIIQNQSALLYVFKS